MFWHLIYVTKIYIQTKLQDNSLIIAYIWECQQDFYTKYSTVLWKDLLNHQLLFFRHRSHLQLQIIQFMLPYETLRLWRISQLIIIYKFWCTSDAHKTKVLDLLSLLPSSSFKVYYSHTRDVSAFAPVRLNFVPWWALHGFGFLRRECPSPPSTRSWEAMPDDLQVKVAAFTHSVVCVCSI